MGAGTIMRAHIVVCGVAAFGVVGSVLRLLIVLGLRIPNLCHRWRFKRWIRTIITGLVLKMVCLLDSELLFVHVLVKV